MYLVPLLPYEEPFTMGYIYFFRGYIYYILAFISLIKESSQGRPYYTSFRTSKFYYTGQSTWNLCLLRSARRMLLLYGHETDSLFIMAFRADSYHTLRDERIFLKICYAEACTHVPRGRCLFVTLQGRPLLTISCEAAHPLFFRYLLHILRSAVYIFERRTAFRHAYMLCSSDPSLWVCIADHPRGSWFPPSWCLYH